MFTPRRNPRYNKLTLDATEVIFGWLQNQWYETSAEEPLLLEEAPSAGKEPPVEEESSAGEDPSAGEEPAAGEEPSVKEEPSIKGGLSTGEESSTADVQKVI